MTNQDFINSVVPRIWVSDWYTKKHWSLSFEDGVLYSWWKHYPLLFMVNGKRFVNNTWYSHSTSKHISMANMFWTSVKLDSSVRWKPTEYDVIFSLNRNKEYIENLISQLKRRGTQKEQGLLRELERVNNTIAYLNS